MKNSRSPLLVAIVGGSGSGKTWLARKLQSALNRDALCISLDDFYRDRSHLPSPLRARVNFDHPRAIDWPSLEAVLEKLLAGKTVRIPCYDFKSHCRLKRVRNASPRPIILLDGLWLLRRPSLRRLFDFAVFIDCPMRTRLSRRLARDLASRGRSEASIRKQFKDAVEPMHRRFVVTQKRWADLVMPHNLEARDAKALAKHLRVLASARKRR